MRVVVLVKADEETEAGVFSLDRMAEMQTFQEELAKAGVWVAGEGLTASTKGKRLTYSGTDRTVTDGPFSEAKELIGGLAIWEVASMDEAVEWARRMPNPSPGGGEVEIRPVLGPGDFGG